MAKGADGAGPLDPAIERWMAIDEEYGSELRQLLENDPDELASLFSGRISFGTAGLRAAMGPGPRLMNRLVVQQTTAGLMDWLEPGAKVIVGFDARHRSETFAGDVVAVVTQAGGRAELIEQPAPTPVLARAVLDCRADAGVMITASHNPPDDNGYKLYLADGIQLVAPADAEIAEAIDRRAADGYHLGNDQQPSSPDEVAAIAGRSLQAHKEVALQALSTDHRSVEVLYSAMHGVGGRHLVDCFVAAGFPAPRLVESQFEPDPDFPTAPFPNPEEPTAFKVALAALHQITQSGSEIDVILANDPDADRLAVAAPDEDGRWRRLSGDDVGALLVDHVIRQDEAKQHDVQAETGRAVVASSIVSSRFIDAIAQAHNVDSVRTLTGFKWVARPIVDRPHDRYLLGYEEALGYCVGDRVRDKDGVSAALVMAEITAGCKAAGETLRGRLDHLYERYGLHATSQLTIGLAGMTDAEAMAAKAKALSVIPERLADHAVVERQDLSRGGALPPTDGVVFHLDDRSRAIIRPSGTEPKIKVYLEVIEPPGPPGTAKEARQRAELRLEELAKSLQLLLGDTA